MRAAAPLVYVRTEAGVVALRDGDSVPDDADQAHVEKLMASGVLSEAAPEPVTPAPVVVPPVPAKPKGSGKP